MAFKLALALVALPTNTLNAVWGMLMVTSFTGNVPENVKVYDSVASKAK